MTDPSMPQPAARLKGRAAIVESWNEIPDTLRANAALTNLWLAVKLCDDVPQPAERKPLTRQQLREAFHWHTGCTLGGDIELAERVCTVVERAHGVGEAGE